MSTTIEIPWQSSDTDAGDQLRGVTFTARDELLVSGSLKGVRAWRMADGKQVAAMLVGRTLCVAASNDGRWIAAGTVEIGKASKEPVAGGKVLVWDATTYEQVFAERVELSGVIDLDFSPDSTHLVSADFVSNTATIWDITARQKVRTLDHDGPVSSVKYSPPGDRIATVTEKSVRVWDSNDGRLLVDINVQVGWFRNILWCDNHLFVLTNDGAIKEIDAATGSTVSEWPVSRAEHSPIALAPHSEFLACSAEKTITFWNITTHTQLASIQHTHDILSIDFSSDGQLLAIATEVGIIVRDLSSILYCAVPEPELVIDSAVLRAWKRGELADAETLLSAAIQTSENRHHVLASRALVRARLGQWDAALVDAKESIKIQRSSAGYVAKCVALVGNGETDSGCGECDIASLRFPSDHLSLLLIKAVVLSMVGKHIKAMSRMDRLITDSTDLLADPALYVVQAYMHLLCGNVHMESSDYERAIQSFEDAQITLGNRTHQPPLIVSLISGWEFDTLAITIKQRLCEALFSAAHIKEAAESVLRIVGEEIKHVETWVSDFKSRCRSKLEDLGDSAVNVKKYDEAVSRYTAVLLLGPASPQDLLAKRSRAYARNGKWEDALNDANDVIKLDPPSPSGYERKYSAQLGIGHHNDAISTFETMLSQMAESSDPEIRERSHHYVRPEQTMKAIRTSIQNAIRDSPSVLINALSGCLCNKSEQATAFELTPDFTTLIASMTTHIDHALIERVVTEFYRYTTFSHTWEGNEPLYEKVTKIVVYDLKTTPTHEKLKMFCKIVRDEGFIWAWSDTCCIDQKNSTVLQESLVSMFKWYEGSEMTIIFLYDVDGLAELGALMMSKWNSRGWTLQEYHASKVVRIYTKDWTPYLGLTIHNHKESPLIISEMEKATGISAEALRALRPGLKDIRQKLCLASARQTTRVEDAAYSLLGIFSMTLRVSYGEGDKALGRLLSELLTSSGDTSILAWTGTPGSFNSCLPTNIIVFSQPVTSHIPLAIPDAEMETITAGLHALELDLDLVAGLYDQVDRLPTPTFAAQRMRLPCLAFKVRNITPSQNGLEVVFRARASALGVVEIRSKHNLARLDSLYLVHPWIDFLLGRHATENTTEIAPHEDEPSGLDVFIRDLPAVSAEDPLDDAESLPSPATVPLMDVHMEFLGRLRQPFGALLLAPTRRNVAEYRRIATENPISAQVQEITPATLNRLIQGVRVLDVL